MADIAQGQEVFTAEGEGLGRIAEVTATGFLVEAPAFGCAIPLLRDDVAGLRGGAVSLLLTRAQLRERLRRESGDREPRAGVQVTREIRRIASPALSPAGPPAEGQWLEPADEEPQDGDQLPVAHEKGLIKTE